MVGGDKRQKEAWPCIGVLPPASEGIVGDIKVQQGKNRMGKSPRSHPMSCRKKRGNGDSQAGVACSPSQVELDFGNG